MYDVIVIGAGIMGSAAARHLVGLGVKTLLVGAEEPAVASTHEGVFASHYDAARITRRLDGKADWARFSSRSIERYAEVEAAGGQSFFHPVGSLFAGPDAGDGKWMLDRCRAVAADQGIRYEDLDAGGLAARFPFFSFPDEIAGLYETGTGGWINPRHHVAAEVAAAQVGGADLQRAEVARVDYEADKVVVHCVDGTQFEGGKAVVACGPFSKAEGLLIEPLPMTVYARTIAFLEIDEAEAARLSQMPSMIYMTPELRYGPYMLPPVRYPDGKIYLKIGGDPEDTALETVADMKAWFRGPGDKAVAVDLAGLLIGLMPGLDCKGVTFGSCATSFSPKGNPLIYAQSDQCVVLTAGNGAGAKCGDELGRLGALVASGQGIPAGEYLTDFKP